MRAPSGSCSEALRAWIEPGIEVSIVTDAGFRRPWFAYIEALGWSWIGRVRGSVCIGQADTQPTKVAHWNARATGQATRWHECTLTARYAWPCDLVLVRRRRVGRKHYARPGHAAIPKARAEARASAQEPWLLAHSRQLRTYRADQIVALYAQRMQIEENFRDSKSLSLGMGLELSRSRSARRLNALLLIHTLAAFLLWHIGQLAETARSASSLQGNHSHRARTLDHHPGLFAVRNAAHPPHRTCLPCSVPTPRIALMKNRGNISLKGVLKRILSPESCQTSSSGGSLRASSSSITGISSRIG